MVYWQEKGGEIVDILSTIVVLIPSVLSLCVSGIYAYIALKKAKEPQKDEIWETATRIMCSSGQSTYADEFIEPVSYTHLVPRRLSLFALALLSDTPESVVG